MSRKLNFEDNPIEQHQASKEGAQKLKPCSDNSKEMESPKNEKTKVERKDELELEDISETLETNVEKVDKVNANQEKGLKPKQETPRKDECTSPSNNKSEANGNSNSPKESPVRTNSDLSNGVANLKSDVNNEEELHECCKRKRSRYDEMECFDCGDELSGLTCIGILPGLGCIIESSDDSDQSCSSGSEGNEKVKYDLLGRSIVTEAGFSTESG